MGGRRLAIHQRFFEIFSPDGSRKEGEIVGRPEGYSNANGFVIVRGEKSSLVQLYELATRAKVDEFTFPESVAQARFSADGKRLLGRDSGSERLHAAGPRFRHSYGIQALTRRSSISADAKRACA